MSEEILQKSQSFKFGQDCEDVFKLAKQLGFKNRSDLIRTAITFYGKAMLKKMENLQNEAFKKEVGAI